MLINLLYVRNSCSFAAIPTDPVAEFGSLQSILGSMPAESLTNPLDAPLEGEPETHSAEEQETVQEEYRPSSVMQEGNKSSISNAQPFAADFDNIRNILASNQPLETTSSGAAVSSIGGPTDRIKPQGNASSVSDGKEFAGVDGLIPADSPEVEAPPVSADMYNRIHFSGAALPGETPVASSINIGSDGVESVMPSGNMSSVSSAEEFAALTPWYKNSSRLKNGATGEYYPYTGEQLYASEVALMNQKFPQAKLYTLLSKELYWVLPITIDTGHVRKEYTVMLKYDNNHPHPNDWGGSCKAIFLKPSINEMNVRLKEKKGSSFTAPHILSLPGSTSEKYLCAISKSEQSNMMRTGEVQGAAAVAARVIRYLYMFEVGLEDRTVWAELCKG